jgi:glutamate synthase (NADPH/NADH) large chain
MTGGVVVILGSTGRNFGAGMTGGVAYVWDTAGLMNADHKYHAEFVDTRALSDCEQAEQTRVRDLIQQHAHKTNSRIGQQLLESWPTSVQQLLRVAPKG